MSIFIPETETSADEIDMDIESKQVQTSYEGTPLLSPYLKPAILSPNDPSHDLISLRPQRLFDSIETENMTRHAAPQRDNTETTILTPAVVINAPSYGSIPVRIPQNRTGQVAYRQGPEPRVQWSSFAYLHTLFMMILFLALFTLFFILSSRYIIISHPDQEHGHGSSEPEQVELFNPKASSHLSSLRQR
jgi:hypothetical protein